MDARPVDPCRFDQLIGYGLEEGRHQVDVERKVQRRVEQDHAQIGVQQAELHELDVDRDHQEQGRDGEPGEHEEVERPGQAPAQLRERVARERCSGYRERDGQEGDDRGVAEVHADVRARPRTLERTEREGRRQPDPRVRPVSFGAKRGRRHEEERQDRRDREEAEAGAERPLDIAVGWQAAGGGCHRGGQGSEKRASLHVYSGKLRVATVYFRTFA